MATTQPSQSTPNGQPVSPDANLTNKQLDGLVSVDLMTIEEAPHAQSGWASAFDPPGLNLGGGTGGGYALSPDELQNIIGQWQNILHRAQGYDQYVSVIRMVTSAADDKASTTFTDQVRATGDNLHDSHESLKAYARAYIARLRASQQTYQNAERANGDAFKNHGHVK